MHFSGNSDASVINEGTINADMVALIARNARGAMRDGLTILDQLMSISPDKITVEQNSEVTLRTEPEKLDYVKEGQPIFLYVTTPPASTYTLRF